MNNQANSEQSLLPSRRLREYNETKKAEKRDKLESAGYELFLSKGIHDVSIDDIVKAANVAKGTFYLYFKDKYDLLDRIVFKLSSDIIGRVFTLLEERYKNSVHDVEEEIAAFIDLLLCYLLENKELLPVLHKNLSQGLYAEFEGHAQEILVRFTESFTAAGGDAQEAKRRLYMIVELSNSVLYNAITSGAPYTLEEIKPLLYSTILHLAKP